MATFALITLPLSGHMNPMMTAARAMMRSGHRPVVIGPHDLIARVPKDIETLTIGARDIPPGELDRVCACLSRMRSWSDLNAMFTLTARLSQFYLKHLPRALERLGADGVIHDQLEPGAGIVGRGLSSKHFAHISLACALPMNREPSVPPPFMGWKYNASAYGHWLNAGYYRIVNALLRPQCEVLAGGAADFGLTKPDGLDDWQQVWSVDDGISRTTDLAQGLASLDFPRERPPIYLGPFRDAGLSYPGLETIAHERDGRPLAFISLGTLMGGRAKVLRAMARAAIHKGLQPVVLHGGRLKDENYLPVGTIARDFLDQRAVMAEASVAIIHGGYNSTTDAVAAGVPLVTVPIAFEQSAIAARVTRAGLGCKVSALGPALSSRISDALGEVLTRDSIAKAARRAQFEALAAPGLDGLIAAIDGAISRTSSTYRAVPSSGRVGLRSPVAAE